MNRPHPPTAFTRTGLFERVRRTDVRRAKRFAGRHGRILSGVVHHPRSPWHSMECQSIPAGRVLHRIGETVWSCRVLSLRSLSARFAAIRGYRIEGTCPDGATPLMKPVVAGSGDTVDVSADGISVNSRLVPKHLASGRRHTRTAAAALSIWSLPSWIAALSGWLLHTTREASIPGTSARSPNRPFGLTSARCSPNESPRESDIRRRDLGRSRSSPSPLPWTSAIAVSIAGPALWIRQPSARFCFCCALAYYLVALRSLPIVARNFFGPAAGFIDGMGLWLIASALLALPWRWLWSPSSDVALWRVPLGLLISIVPPLGLIGWASPTVAAGLLFPATGYVGFALTLCLPGCLAVAPKRTLVCRGYSGGCLQRPSSTVAECP